MVDAVREIRAEAPKPEMRDGPIAILGGTGDQGLGLALRFCAAGRAVVIGSRTQGRAVAAMPVPQPALSCIGWPS